MSNPTPTENSGIADKALISDEEIAKRLERAYTRDWDDHYPTIKAVVSGHQDRVNDRARAFAVILEIIRIKDSHKVKLTRLHAAYKQFGFKKPKLRHYQVFYRFFSEGPGSGPNVNEQLLEFLKDKPRGAGKTRFVGESVKRLVQATYSDTSKHRMIDIAIIVNSYILAYFKKNGLQETLDHFQISPSQCPIELIEAKKVISVSCVKKFLPRKIKSRLDIKRYGLNDFRNGTTPIRRKKSENPLDRIEVDATQFTFAFYDPEKDKITSKLVTCIAVDTCTNYIPGFSIGRTESADLFINTVKNTVRRTGVLPKEIFTDQFPGHNSNEIRPFFNGLRELGCFIDIERTGNARAKGTVESTINQICAMLRKDPDFIGGNITSKSRDSRKSPEVIVQITRNAKFKTEADIRLKLASVIEEFNRQIIGNGNHTRKSLFEELPKPNAIAIPQEQFIWLFLKEKELRVNRGLLEFTTNRRDYVYELPEQYKFEFNKELVAIRYLDQDLAEGADIYLFNLKTKQLVCNCSEQRKPHLARVNQTDEDKEIYKDHIERKKAFVAEAKKAVAALEPESIEIMNHLNSSKIDLADVEETYLTREMAGVGLPDIGEKVLLKKQDGKTFKKVAGKSTWEETGNIDRLYIGMGDKDIIPLKPWDDDDEQAGEGNKSGGEKIIPMNPWADNDDDDILPVRLS